MTAPAPSPFPAPENLPQEPKEEVIADYEAAAPPREGVNDGEEPFELDEEGETLPPPERGGPPGMTFRPAAGGGVHVSMDAQRRERREERQPAPPDAVFAQSSADKQTELFRSLAQMHPGATWWVRRDGPPRRSDGTPVQLGLYPEEITGRLTPKAIWARLRGGTFAVTPNDPYGQSEVRWYGPIEILGEPALAIDLDEAVQKRRGQGQGDDEEMVAYQVPGFGLAYISRAEAARRGSMPMAPGVSTAEGPMQKVLEQLAAQAERTQKTLEMLMQRALEPPKTDDGGGFFAKYVEAERLRADREAETRRLEVEKYKADAEVRKAEIAERQALQVAEINRRQAEAEAALNRQREEAKEERLRLAEERKAERERSDSLQRTVFDAVGRRDSASDPMKTLGTVMGLARDMTGIMGGGAEPAGAVVRVLEKAEKALGALYPAMEDPLRKLFWRIAEGDVKALPAPQPQAAASAPAQSPQPQPQPQAQAPPQPQGPPEPTEAQKMLLNGIVDVVELIEEVLSGKVEAGVAWDAVKPTLPASILARVSSIKKAGDVSAGLRLMASQVTPFKTFLPQGIDERMRKAADLADGDGRERAEALARAISGASS